MNVIDSLVAFFSPVSALKRAHARGVLAAYEAAKPDRMRKFRLGSGGQNRDVQRAALPIRNQIAHLVQNHDLAAGMKRTMVNNIVGPNGIGIEPQPRRRDGEIHTEYAAQLRDAWRDWCKKPEVTHQHHWARCCRIAAGEWVVDGEIFAQQLIGRVPNLDHGTNVPFSIELIPARFLPIHYDNGDNIRQSIQRNAWGKATKYWCYKTDPDDAGYASLTPDKSIPAERMIHLAFFERHGQLRGMSPFASIITRLEDIKDYEESERVAAKIAAMLTAYVKRGTPELYDPGAQQKDEHGNVVPREIRLAPGTIIDNLAMGEEVGLIDSSRPNPNLITFRQGQLRAAAAGFGISYSSASKDYNGTYSAQRQELVEQWVNYAVLTDDFVGQFVQPIWESFVIAAHLSGVVTMPEDLKPGSADDALFIGQAMPWINPLHEAGAFNELVRGGFMSEPEVIRRRGGNPRDVMDQQAAWRAAAKEKGLVLASDAANDKANPPTLKQDPASSS